MSWAETASWRCSDAAASVLQVSSGKTGSGRRYLCGDAALKGSSTPEVEL